MFDIRNLHNHIETGIDVDVILPNGEVGFTVKVKGNDSVAVRAVLVQARKSEVDFNDPDQAEKLGLDCVTAGLVSVHGLTDNGIEVNTESFKTILANNSWIVNQLFEAMSESSNFLKIVPKS